MHKLKGIVKLNKKKRKLQIELKFFAINQKKKIKKLPNVTEFFF